MRCSFPFFSTRRLKARSAKGSLLGNWLARRRIARVAECRQLELPAQFRRLSRDFFNSA